MDRKHAAGMIFFAPSGLTRLSNTKQSRITVSGTNSVVEFSKSLHAWHDTWDVQERAVVLVDSFMKLEIDLESQKSAIGGAAAGSGWRGFLEVSVLRGLTCSLVFQKLSI